MVMRMARMEGSIFLNSLDQKSTNSSWAGFFCLRWYLDMLGPGYVANLRRNVYFDPPDCSRVAARDTDNRASPAGVDLLMERRRARRIQGMEDRGDAGLRHRLRRQPDRQRR